MKITSIMTCEGFGASYTTDLEAVRQGAKPDETGMLFVGKPVTPGFDSIRQPATALCLMMELEDGQIALGDCMTTIFPGRKDRADVQGPDALAALVNEVVSPLLVGRDVTRFKPNDDLIAAVETNGSRLSPAIRYGVSQALLQATALAQRTTMAEVLADEWRTPLTDKPLRLNLQTGPDFDRGLDRIILRRGDIIHSRNPHNPSMLPAVPAFLERARERLKNFAPDSYRPAIHIDFYGVLGKVYANDVRQIVDCILSLGELIYPYEFIVGDPVEAPTRGAQVEVMAAIRQQVRERAGHIRLLVEEFCLDMEDHAAFLDGHAADFQKIRPLDLGNIGRMMDIGAMIASRRDEANVGIYFTGSGTETDVAARARVHVAKAMQADFMLASPGMGVDEAHSLIVNEARRLDLRRKTRMDG